MQTTIQFGSPTTFQEWSNFKGKLNELKKNEGPFLTKGSNAENLVYHLTKQIQAGVLR